MTTPVTSGRASPARGGRSSIGLWERLWLLPPRVRFQIAFGLLASLLASLAVSADELGVAGEAAGLAVAAVVAGGICIGCFVATAHRARRAGLRLRDVPQSIEQLQCHYDAALRRRIQQEEQRAEYEP